MNTKMKLWFTRFPQKDINPVYLRNIRKATLYFMDWFKNGTISYTKMLVKMHEISSNGYSGCTNTKASQDKIQSLFRNYSQVPKIEKPILKKEWYNINTTKTIISPKIKDVPIHLSHYLLNLDKGYKLHLPVDKLVPYYLCKLER